MRTFARIAPRLSVGNPEPNGQTDLKLGVSRENLCRCGKISACVFCHFRCGLREGIQARDGRDGVPRTSSGVGITTATCTDGSRPVIASILSTANPVPIAASRRPAVPIVSSHQASDPNGIRTRVTAVKGRCPGPLDDRVIRRLPDRQYRNCHRWTQGKLAAELKYPHFEWRVALSAAVRGGEPAWLSALSRPGARAKQHVRFPRDAGALLCHGEARQQRARASRRPQSGSRHHLKSAF